MTRPSDDHPELATRSFIHSSFSLSLFLHSSFLLYVIPLTLYSLIISIHSVYSFCVCVCVYSFDKHVLSIFYVTGTILGSGVTMISKTKMLT